MKINSKDIEVIADKFDSYCSQFKGSCSGCKFEKLNDSDKCGAMYMQKEINKLIHKRKHIVTEYISEIQDGKPVMIMRESELKNVNKQLLGKYKKLSKSKKAKIISAALKVLTVGLKLGIIGLGFTIDSNMLQALYFFLCGIVACNDFRLNHKVRKATNSKDYVGYMIKKHNGFIEDMNKSTDSTISIMRKLGVK